MINKYEPLIPSIVDKFRHSGENFDLLSSQDNVLSTEWLKNNFPIASWGRIDWEKVQISLCIKYSDDAELLSAFEKIVAERQLEGNLIVLWSNALTLPIKINIDVLKKYAEQIFQEDWDTWICNEPDQWCIENYHDGEICWGKCSS